MVVAVDMTSALRGGHECRPRHLVRHTVCDNGSANDWDGVKVADEIYDGLLTNLSVSGL